MRPINLTVGNSQLRAKPEKDGKYAVVVVTNSVIKKFSASKAKLKQVVSSLI